MLFRSCCEIPVVPVTVLVAEVSRLLSAARLADASSRLVLRILPMLVRYAGSPEVACPTTPGKELTRLVRFVDRLVMSVFRLPRRVFRSCVVLPSVLLVRL